MRDVLGVSLLIVQTVLVVPLVLKVIRARSADGMSLASEAIWVVAGIGWALYGHGTGSVTLIASGTIAAVGSGALTALMWRYKTSTEKRAAVVLVVITATGLFTPHVVAGVGGLSLALAAFGVVQFVPQIVDTLRGLRGTGQGLGVSVLGTSLRALYTFGWAFYAGAWVLWGIPVSQIDWPLVAWGLAGAVAFGLQAATAHRASSHRDSGTGGTPTDTSVDLAGRGDAR